jgi:Predicted membrane protein
VKVEEKEDEERYEEKESDEEGNYEEEKDEENRTEEEKEKTDERKEEEKEEKRRRRIVKRRRGTRRRRRSSCAVQPLQPILVFIFLQKYYNYKHMWEYFILCSLCSVILKYRNNVQNSVLCSSLFFPPKFSLFSLVTLQQTVPSAWLLTVVSVVLSPDVCSLQSALRFVNDLNVNIAVLMLLLQ